MTSFSTYDWLTNFRMSQSTFMFIYNEIRHEVAKTDTIMRRALSVEKRVAITLWFLSSNADFRTISHLFGVSKSSISVIRKSVCRAFVKLLLPKYISFPTDARLKHVMDGFKCRGFPQCVGAIDGTHIPVEAPTENATNYYNRKGWNSIILQGTVDHEGLFIDICAGWPGRVHDARVFANSGLNSRAERGELLPASCSQRLSGIDVPGVLVGDPAYPLHPWLMKPYINHGHLTPQEQNFNTRLSKARIVVEHAFGRLKGRWRCLRNKLHVSLESVPETIGACCVLHNLCQIHGDAFDDEWLETASERDTLVVAQQSIQTSAENIRKALKEHYV